MTDTHMEEFAALIRVELEKRVSQKFADGYVVVRLDHLEEGAEVFERGLVVDSDQSRIGFSESFRKNFLCDAAYLIVVPVQEGGIAAWASLRPLGLSGWLATSMTKFMAGRLRHMLSSKGIVPIRNSQFARERRAMARAALIPGSSKRVTGNRQRTTGVFPGTPRPN